MGLQGMQGSGQGGVPSQGELRVLDFGAVRLHQRHIQGGRRTVSECRLCEEGLAGISQVVERKPAPVEAKVAEDHGGDEEEDASPPLDSWAS